MQKDKYILLSLVLALVICGCTDGFYMAEEIQPGSPGSLTIRLRNSSMSRSADSDNSEWKIDNLIIALYSGDSDDEQEPIKWIVKENLNTSDYYTVSIPLTADLVDVLFTESDDAGEMGGGGIMRDLSLGGGGIGDEPEPGTRKCRFFVVANLTDNLPSTENIDNISDKSTISELRELAIESGFKADQIQDSFVMAAEGEAEYQEPATANKLGYAEGEASLTRAAAKILLNVKFTEEPVEVKNESGEVIGWLPDIDTKGSIKVLLHNGVFKAVAEPENNGGGILDDWPDPDVPELQDLSDGDLIGGDEPFDPGFDENEGFWKPSDVDAYYDSDLSIENSYRKLQEVSGESDYPWQMDVPFYSYPNAWEETPDEAHKTYLTLMVPWKKVVDGEPTNETKYFYYVIPVTDADCIIRNFAYIINLNVGMLGSEVPDVPVELTDLSYQVVTWGEEEINVEIQDIRYLVVNPNTYVVNNESVISIPFYTSHPVVIDTISMTYQRFNYPSNGSGEMVEIPISKTVIDRSTWTHDGVTDTICNYSIVRDPITKMLNIRIEHPMVLWKPRSESGQTVSLVEVGEVGNLENTIKQIYKYARPEEAEMAYSPYFFEVTLKHKDNDNFKETVWITQYPGMYIVVDQNPGGSYFSKDPTKPSVDPNSYNYGYTFLNAEEIRDPIKENDIVTGYGPYFWRNADTAWEGDFDLGSDENDPPSETLKKEYYNYLAKGMGGLRPYVGSAANGVTNPNMYLINITQLASGEEYIIGETRSSVINNDLSGEELPKLGYTQEAGEWCSSADALYNKDGQIGKRKLKYYYPTNEDDSYKMRVAPKLRVSSSYGFVRLTSNIVDRAIGRRRAATYQEQGYPAGRWRLPTYGEVKLIVSLSAEEKIPELFSVGQNYLTAQGAYEVLETGELKKLDTIPFEIVYSNNHWIGSRDNGVNVRPVYDEWFWENEKFDQMKPDGDGGYVYTYGDMPLK